MKSRGGACPTCRRERLDEPRYVPASRGPNEAAVSADGAGQHGRRPVQEGVRHGQFGLQPLAGRTAPAASSAERGRVDAQRDARRSTGRAGSRAGSAPRCAPRRRRCRCASNTATEIAAAGQLDGSGQPVRSRAHDDGVQHRRHLRTPLSADGPGYSAGNGLGDAGDTPRGGRAPPVPHSANPLPQAEPRLSPSGPSRRDPTGARSAPTAVLYLPRLYLTRPQQARIRSTVAASRAGRERKRIAAALSGRAPPRASGAVPPASSTSRRPGRVVPGGLPGERRPRPTRPRAIGKVLKPGRAARARPADRLPSSRPRSARFWSSVV
jgi:hypothetical protein